MSGHDGWAGTRKRERRGDWRGEESGLVEVLVREVTGNGIRRCHKYLAAGITVGKTHENLQPSPKEKERSLTSNLCSALVCKQRNPPR